MDLFPSDPKKLRAKIRRFERLLRKEKEETGFYDDGYGKRLLIGPMYVLMEDISGALQYYTWYETEFPDDSAYPMSVLCWTLALYRAGRTDEAESKLRVTMFSNLYLLPHLLDLDPVRADISPGSNWQWTEHLEEIPDELFDLWDEDAIAWARDVYNHPETQRLRDRYVALEVQLKDEPVGPKRTQLVEELFAIRRGG